MVNEHEGKKYKPTPVYNRKLLRSMIRAGFIHKYGHHNVSPNVTVNFKELRGKTHEKATS